MKALILIMLTCSAIFYGCKKEDSSLELTLQNTNNTLSALIDEQNWQVNRDFERNGKGERSFNSGMKAKYLILEGQLAYIDSKINLLKQDSVSDIYPFIYALKMELIMKDLDVNPLSINRYSNFYKYNYVDKSYTKDEAISQLLILKNELLGACKNSFNHTHMHEPCFTFSPCDFIKINDNELVYVRPTSKRFNVYTMDSIIFNGIYYKHFYIPKTSYERSANKNFETYHIKYPDIGNAGKEDIRLKFTAYILDEAHTFEEY